MSVVYNKFFAYSDVVTLVALDKVRNNSMSIIMPTIDNTHTDYEQYQLSHDVIDKFKQALISDEPYIKRFDLLIELNLFTKSCTDASLLAFVIENLCRQVHGSTYEYPSQLKAFDIFSDKITIICRDHGEFYMTLRDHLIPNKLEIEHFDIYRNKPLSCHECYVEACRINANRRQTTAMFIMNAERRFKLTTDYRYVDYGNVVNPKDDGLPPSDRKILIICTTCSKDNNITISFQRPYIHLRSNPDITNGCGKCCRESVRLRSKKLWSDPEFAKMKTEHSRKQTNDPAFKLKMSKLLTERMKDDTFRKLLTSDEVIEKRRISSQNFDPSTPADMYVMRGPQLTHGIPIKIGHSTRLNSRIANFKCGTGYEFTPIWIRHFEDGLDSARLEEMILNHESIKDRLWNIKVGGVIVRKGSSEIVFVKDDSELSEIIRIVNEVSDSFFTK